MIRLTGWTDDSPAILVNPEHIVAVIDSIKYRKVCVVNGDLTYFMVRESVEQIRKLLNAQPL